jgi:molybdopterin converting factor small subunit
MSQHDPTDQIDPRGGVRPHAMTVVRLRGPLKQRAGGRAEHSVAGPTIGDLLRTLERENPGILGWILDERGQIRRHINVFVNGERGDRHTKVGEGDEVDVLPAISGGSNT